MTDFSTNNQNSPAMNQMIQALNSVFYGDVAAYKKCLQIFSETDWTNDIQQRKIQNQANLIAKYQQANVALKTPETPPKTADTVQQVMQKTTRNKSDYPTFEEIDSEWDWKEVAAKEGKKTQTKPKQFKKPAIEMTKKSTTFANLQHRMGNYTIPGCTTSVHIGSFKDQSFPLMLWEEVSKRTVQTLTITNYGKTKQAFKIKCSDNKIFVIFPVFSFADVGQSVDILVTREAAPMKPDKIVVVVASATDADCKNIAGHFKKPTTMTTNVVILQAAGTKGIIEAKLGKEMNETEWMNCFGSNEC